MNKMKNIFLIFSLLLLIKMNVFSVTATALANLAKIQGEINNSLGKQSVNHELQNSISVKKNLALREEIFNIKKRQKLIILNNLGEK